MRHGPAVRWHPATSIASVNQPSRRSSSARYWRSKKNRESTMSSPEMCEPSPDSAAHSHQVWGCSAGRQQKTEWQQTKSTTDKSGKTVSVVAMIQPRQAVFYSLLFSCRLLGSSLFGCLLRSLFCSHWLCCFWLTAAGLLLSCPC